MILRVKVKKQLDCEANSKIESGQEIVSEQCSLQECREVTWRVSDCEELVWLLAGDYGVGFLVYNLKKLFSIYSFGIPVQFTE